MIPIEGVLDHYQVEYNPERGGNQKVLCPFHEDTNPSASVNLDMGLFNCYGCAVAGDAIQLLMDRQGLTFIAAKRLAEEMAGGTRPEVSRRSDSGHSLLPRKQRSRDGGRGWKSPWVRRES